MRRLISNLVAIASGCALILAVNNYLIPFNTEVSAIAFSVIALMLIIVGIYGFADKLINS